MESPTLSPGNRPDRSSSVASAVRQLANFLDDADARARRGGRPPLRVQWTRKLGTIPLSEIVIQAVLPLSPYHPTARRVANAIVSALGRIAGSGQLEDLGPSGRATLGWSLLVAAIDAVRTPDGQEPLSLVLRTRYRTRGGKLHKMDRYHLAANASWIEDLSSDPQSRDWLIPPDLLLSHADPLFTSSPDDRRPLPAPYQPAIQVLEKTRYVVNHDLIRISTELGELSGEDLGAVRLAKALGPRAFRFRVHVDFRGELRFRCDQLSPTGSDFQRALLQFADPGPLGRRGKEHLAAHGCRLFDGSFDGRPEDSLDWVHGHDRLIREATTDPLRQHWWRTALRPWQFLAFCWEWTRFMDSETEGDFWSRLPIRTPFLAPEEPLRLGSSVLDIPAPKFCHETLVQRVIARLTQSYENGSEWAARWLRGPSRPVLRDLISNALGYAVADLKPYTASASLAQAIRSNESSLGKKSDFLAPIRQEIGVTPETACAYLSRRAQEIDTTTKKKDRERLVRCLEAKVEHGDMLAREWLRSKLIDTPTARAAGHGSKTLMSHLKGSNRWPEVESFRGTFWTRISPGLHTACCYLTRLVRKVVAGAGVDFGIAARDWARRACSAGCPVSWTVPRTGFTVTQPYSLATKCQASIRLKSGEKIQPAFFEPVDQVNRRRQIDRFPQNLLTSMEAGEAILALSAISGTGPTAAAVDGRSLVLLPGEAEQVLEALQSEHPGLQPLGESETPQETAA